MHHYSQGIQIRQAHKGIPEGHFEEEQGLKGFFGPVSHLIRKKPSTRWTDIDGPLKPRMFDLVKMVNGEGYQKLFYNSQLKIETLKVSVSKGNCEHGSFRNADGDLIYFCHSGNGIVLTEYGQLNFSKGEYIVIPKCIGHTIFCESAAYFLVIESKSSHYEEPDRGMLGRHAVYDTNAIGKPNLMEQNEFLKKRNIHVKSVSVRHNETLTCFKYDECIYDVVGWKGDLFPYTLHMDNMMPLMSHRAHLPPSAHSTFVARDFVICTFLPRPLEQDEDALKVPFYHQNIDYDEVIFYHDGDFFSRDNLHPGMISFHPAGFPHGPHPKAVKGIGSKTHTEEYAVMIDTRQPLMMDDSLSDVELKNYWTSWSEQR